jgi:hypothetical protein
MNVVGECVRVGGDGQWQEDKGGQERGGWLERARLDERARAA